MIIRQAQQTDSSSIVEFQLAMAMETEQLQLNEPTVEKGVAAVFADSSKGIYYVAEIKGQVVGSLLTTFEWSDWRNGTVLWIQSVYVLSLIHISEPTRLGMISYAVFCLKKKKKTHI